LLAMLRRWRHRREVLADAAYWGAVGRHHADLASYHARMAIEARDEGRPSPASESAYRRHRDAYVEATDRQAALLTSLDEP